MSAEHAAALAALAAPAAGSAPLTPAELAAVHGVPKLRTWAGPKLCAYGSHVLAELVAGREAVGLAEFLGMLRAEISRELRR
jgi:hypothetical protein